MMMVYTNSEFCGEENHDVDVSLEDIPNESVCDYLLEAAEEEEKEIPDKEGKKTESKGKKTSGRSNLVIFAVDVSGSMSSTITVPDLQGIYKQSINIMHVLGCKTIM